MTSTITYGVCTVLTTSLHFVFLSDESLLMRLYKNGIRLIEVSRLFLPTYVHRVTCTVFT